ncbi:MAG: hypothetical protein RIF32_23230 [Leptospirales bacterium]|jgi:hypothetical protein
MISYTVYKFIHLAGILMIFFSLGGVVMHVANGGSRDNTFRKIAAITHGIGMVLVLVAGFGMLARLGIHWPWPGWITAKLLLWLLFGAALGLIYRFANHARLLWYITLALAILTVYLVIFKPF